MLTAHRVRKVAVENMSEYIYVKIISVFKNTEGNVAFN